MDKVRNEYIRGTAHVARLERKQENHGYIGRRMLRMCLAGKRKRRRPKKVYGCVE